MDPKQNTKLGKMLGGLTPAQVRAFLSGLDPSEAQAIVDDWSLWQMPHQVMPGGVWKKWVCRAGRGSGKSYMASRHTHDVAKDLKKIGNGEIAIIAKTWKNATKCVEVAANGILATAPKGFRPEWNMSKGILKWPNGVIGRIYSADEPDTLRNSSWSWAWLDEFCFWPNVEKTWKEVIDPALREGWARCIMTSTPKPLKWLRELEAQRDTVVTEGSTLTNHFLSDSVRQGYIDNYGGTRVGRQELDGQILDVNEGALWTHGLINRYRVGEDYDLALTRVIVAIDPATTSGEDSDETGIIVAGRDALGHVYILEDLTCRCTPPEWAKIAIEAFHNWKANLIVAETNQGGDMVGSIIKLLDPGIPFKKIHAKKGKVARAEPVHLLYEQGKVHHVGKEFPALEDQQTEWEPGKPSPDRLDALVYAVQELADAAKPGLSPAQAYSFGNNLRR